MEDKEKQEKVFDILNKFEFFHGQRAGRELWNDKPKEVQDKDISDFIKDINYIRSYLQDSVVLSKEEYERITKELVTEQRATEIAKEYFEKIRKETTDKIFEVLYQWLDLENIEKYGFVTIQKFDFLRKFREIYKQFGLEIKE